MKSQGITAALWVAAIAATTYLANGQDFAPTLIIILVVLAAVNIFFVQAEKKQ